MGLKQKQKQVRENGLVFLCKEKSEKELTKRKNNSIIILIYYV
jgi:hypothetical protein